MLELKVMLIEFETSPSFCHLGLMFNPAISLSRTQKNQKHKQRRYQVYLQPVVSQLHDCFTAQLFYIKKEQFRTN